ncbi:hypothetical protein ACFOZY_09450 [Chungangia koreensis]|uniref:HlyD family secretion protein n=1 Tax=Chungangia koreensis TaxID=752657 RepID=A0ABV8X4D4_9LACT
MSKLGNIAVAILITCFIAANAILLFSEKSVITKTVYVDDYERLTAGNYTEELPKEGLVAPLNSYFVYVADDENVEEWLVKEGDAVTMGQEIASLNTARSDEQRAVWEADRQALMSQENDLESQISGLESDRSRAASNNRTSADTTESVGTGDAQTDVNVDVDVNVADEGAYAAAISELEKELGHVQRQIAVLDAQLQQDESNSAVLSPVDGVVAKIHPLGEQLAVEIFSTERNILTFAVGEQWQDIKPQSRVLIQADGMEKVVEGTVQSVSQVPSTDDEWVAAYQKIAKDQEENPLAYYEVRVLPNESIEALPFANNANVSIIVNEAEDAISVKAEWLDDRFKESAVATIVNEDGYAVRKGVLSPFDYKDRAVIVEGLELGDLAIDHDQVDDYTYAPAVFFPMPSEMPEWSSWKSFGWENYFKYLWY